MSDHFIPRENPNRNRFLTLCSGIVALSALLVYESGLFSAGPRAVPPETENAVVEIKPVDSVFARRRKTDPTYPVPDYIAQQMPAGDYSHIKRTLMAITVEAVRVDDRQNLANGLALLGAAALSENDLAASRVYLDEALEVYEELDEPIGIGSVELLRSRVETVARENARDAATAHDVMQIAAWMITRNRFAESEFPIQTSIEENLRLDRFGAAAAGYEMLERGYRLAGNTLAANNAAAQSALLHASIGRISAAQEALARLDSHAYPREDIEALEQRITELEQRYHRSIQEAGRARDFEQLYRRFIRAGDPVQAWTFRQKADQSLSLASKRAMHRRQTGIVALLYNSNSNQRKAVRSLARARNLFSEAARTDLVDYVDVARENIW